MHARDGGYLALAAVDDVGKDDPPADAVMEEGAVRRTTGAPPCGRPDDRRPYPISGAVAAAR